MINLNSIIKIRNDIDVTDFDNEKVMMDMEKGKYYSLNEIGSIIWDNIKNNECYKVIDVVNALLKEYDIDKDSCEVEVINYLKELEINELITVE